MGDETRISGNIYNQSVLMRTTMMMMIIIISRKREEEITSP